jgi:Zn-dependent protease
MTQSAYPGSQQLEELASQAMRLEPINPAAAAMVWRQALGLLPPESAAFQQINQRIGALIAGWSPAPATAGRSTQTWSPGVQEIPGRNRLQRQVRPPDALPLAIMKTVGSMILSIVVYYYLVFPTFAIAAGFVVLILIHEMGHVLAMRYYGLSASPPIFIPFVGALINLRQQPPNALVESVIGIGGPLLGTIGALICYAMALVLPIDQDLRFQLFRVAELAIFLNLFNLLPVPPLDGGRVTAAISPWLWIAGLAGLFAMMFVEARAEGIGALIIPVLILVYAFPRIRATFQARGRKDPYYEVSRAASWTMGAIYLGLGALLTFMFLHLNGISFLHEIGL